MKWRTGVLAAAFAEVARAVPQKGIVPIFPIRNSTTPKPEPTDSGCAAQCSVYYPELSALSWVPEVLITYTTTITVGTVSVRILTESNSTLDIRTETIYGYVPPEYDLYMRTTDDAGTAVAQVRLTGSDGYTFTNIAYPTPYVNYFTEYLWGGVLPTSDKASSPICATATDGLSNRILSQHPEYPQPKEVELSSNDTLGTSSQPLWVPIAEEPDKVFFDVAFPSESAFASCESMPGRTKPLPTDFYAAKYVYDTTTETTTPFTVPIVGIMSTETGWEVTTPTKKADKTDGPVPVVPTGPPDAHPQIPHFESSESNFGRTFEPPPVATPKPGTKPGDRPGNPPNNDPGSSPQGDPDQDIPNAIISLINNNPQIFTPGPNPNNPRPPSNNQNDPNNPPVLPAVVSTPAPAATPLFTFVPTVVNGQSTIIPAFILPGSSATATLGQTVTINGQPTVLTPPPTVFTFVPTTIDGQHTSVPAYIISGTSTASIGQTVTLDGTPTVLSPPLAIWTLVPTTINGQATSVFAYVYPSTTGAPAPAQTDFPGPDVILTTMETTINGTPTTIPVWVISGSITATPGQTITVGGKTTVLATPTSSGAGASQTGKAGELPQSTGTGGHGQGVGNRASPTVGKALCIGVGVAFMAWL